MFVVGLTGGIGSGKSTVAKLFAEFGATVIDADVIARELTQPGEPALMDIVDHFNQQLLLDNGTLDRAKLRQIIFTHAEERRWLEQLLHPLIEARIIADLKNIHTSYAVIVVPLLLEIEPYDFINRILVVDCPEFIQVERVTKRDDTTKTNVQAIINTQLPRELRLSQADDVIRNDGDTEGLKGQVERLHQNYMRLAQG